MASLECQVALDVRHDSGSGGIGILDTSCEGAGVVVCGELRAELITCADGQLVVVVSEAEDRCKAPAALDAVELQVDEVDVVGNSRHVRVHETTVVAVVVVGTDTDSSREVVVDLAGDVELSAVDILLALHVGAVIIFVGCESTLSQHGTDGHLEHGDALVVLYETTATHDADHGRESPHVFLVGSEEGRDDGG